MSDYLEEYEDHLDGDELVRCPQCGQAADENMWFADDDPDHEQPYCECGYVWPVAVDVVPVCPACGGASAITEWVDELDEKLYGQWYCDQCDWSGEIFEVDEA